MRSIVHLVLIAIWVMGVVIAKGFWSTLFALFIPFWGWYLVMGQIVIKYL